MVVNTRDCFQHEEDLFRLDLRFNIGTVPIPSVNVTVIGSVCFMDGKFHGKPLVFSLE